MPMAWTPIPRCVGEARTHAIPVVQDNVIDHLRTIEPGALDAIFSAHLVEHLPYEVVLELIELSFRALRPGGRLLLATPNPRALVSHLEMYTMHFGHVAMYHPNLLAFFMRYAGFAARRPAEKTQLQMRRMLRGFLRWFHWRVRSRN